jgi:hypothetical protein
MHGAVVDEPQTVRIEGNAGVIHFHALDPPGDTPRVLHRDLVT